MKSVRSSTKQRLCNSGSKHEFDPQANWTDRTFKTNMSDGIRTSRTSTNKCSYDESQKSRGTKQNCFSNSNTYSRHDCVCMQAMWSKFKCTGPYRKTMEQLMQSIWYVTDMIGDDDQCSSNASKAFRDKQDFNNNGESALISKRLEAMSLGGARKLRCFGHYPTLARSWIPWLRGARKEHISFFTRCCCT